MKKGLYRTLQVVLLAIIIFCVWNIGSYVVQRVDSDNQYEEIQSSVKSLETKSGKESKQAAKDAQVVASLKAKNKDTVAWISIDGTENEYPVVQRDNSYYLSHDFQGQTNVAGVPFLDQDNKPDFSDQNSVIYGHMLRYNNSMFGIFRNYFDQSYVDASPKTITITTDKGPQVYRIFSIHHVPEEANYRSPNLPEADYLKFLQATKNDSEIDFKYDKELTAQDRIITLSTCPPNRDWSKRVAIVAVLQK